MDQGQFRDGLSGVNELTTLQRTEAVQAAAASLSEGAASLAALELAVDERRRCPHCERNGAVSRGRDRGLRRYRCKGCGKTFNALTGTKLAGLHHKERWLAFGSSLAEAETLKESAKRCGIAPTTAHRWRHRFLAALRQSPERLSRIVDVEKVSRLKTRNRRKAAADGAPASDRPGGKRSTSSRTASTPQPKRGCKGAVAAPDSA